MKRKRYKFVGAGFFGSYTTESDSIDNIFCRTLYHCYGSALDNEMYISNSENFSIYRRERWFGERLLMRFDKDEEERERHHKEFRKYCRELE